MATMTTTQAANALGLSIRTIQRHAKTGKLTAHKDSRGRWIITLEDAVTLPQLTDRNPNVIPIAEADRRAMLDRLTEQLTQTAGNVPAEALAELTAIYREVALRHTDAGWWLNNNSRSIAPIVQREFTDADKARLTELRERFTA